MAFKLNKVLLLDGLDPCCEKILSGAGISTKTLAKLSKEELIKELSDCQGVVVRSATKVTADVLGACSNLKVVGRAGTGVDNIDVAAATKNGVLVMNTPGGNTLSAAEQTCNLICSLSRSIPQACASLKEGKWDRKQYMGNELYGKVLAIVGLGRIGREVSSRMKSFGMRVIGFDPIVSPEAAASWGIEYFSLDQLWPQADYITVHTPLIPQTRNLIGEASLAKCKPTVRIVNVARGGIVDEKALLKALEEGKCGGAGLDVFESEPPQDFSLIKHPKVICTPHLGANTVEAQKRVAEEIAEQFIAMSEGKSLFGIVNKPELESAGSPEVQPWISLAIYLGAIISPNNESPLKISVTFGNNSKKFSRLLKSAVLQGVLKNQYGNRVNLVNASSLAESRQVVVEDDETNTGNTCDDAISAKVFGNPKICTISGVLVGSNPALLELNGSIWSPAALLGGNSLLYESETNVPVSNIVAALSSYDISSLSILNSGSRGWCLVNTSKLVDQALTVSGANLVNQF